MFLDEPRHQGGAKAAAWHWFQAYVRLGLYGLASVPESLLPRYAPVLIGPATAIALTAAVLLPAVGGWQIIRDRSATLADARQSVKTLGHALGEQAVAVVHQVDLLLSETAARVESGPDRTAIAAFVKGQSEMGARNRFLAVIDRTGDLVAYEQPFQAPVNLADRAYFVWHRDHADGDLHFDQVLTTRVDRHLLIPLSRRIADRDGAFDGVAVAGLLAEDFQAFYDNLDVGPHGIVALWSTDGTLLVRRPRVDSGSSGAVRSDVLSKLDPDRSGVLERRSSIDGVDRILAFERVGDYPLVLTVALSVDDVLRVWVYESAIQGAVLAVASLALILLALGLERSRRTARRDSLLRQDADRRYRLLADSTSDVIAQLDLNLTRRYVSPSCLAMLGYEPQALVGGQPAETMHPDDVDAVSSSLRTVTAGAAPGDRVMATYRFRHRAGHWVWLEAAISLIRDQGTGAPVSLICSLRDVTERQRAARDLEQARDAAEAAARVKSEFVANMSHELRTPLTGILGIHDLMHADPLLDERHRRYLTMARDSGRALLTIVNDVLDFSKIEAGEIAIDVVGFDPRRLIETCLDLGREMAVKKGLSIEARFEGLVPTLRGDPNRLRQVLLNLLTNAIKFTDRGGVLVDTTYTPEMSRLRVRVTDSGVGIPPEKLGLLFDRFTQADNSVTRRYGGTGLGLAISKRLLELMGGEIGVESQSGTGSTFWFALPLQAEGTAAPAPPPAGPTPESRPLHVLLAEDNLVNQDIISAMLESRGHDVTIVGDGAMAVEALKTAGRYDLVFMDLQMPVMDGLSAAQAIRRTERTSGAPPVPIFGLTANAMTGDVERCLGAGMDGHIPKPIEWETLFATIDRIGRTGAMASSSTRADAVRDAASPVA